MSNTENTCAEGLGAPARPNYFYGKLLDEQHFKMEQSYFNNKRWLLNRLLFGSGVVCGLGLSEPDGDGMVWLQPGVAIDGCGREIVVPEAVPLDPSRLTDDQGNETGETAGEGQVEICLLYAEELVDPVPVLVPDCETPGDCAHSTIREGYRVVVRPIAPEEEEEGEDATDQGAIPWTDNAELQALLCERISEACPQADAGACLPLARVDLPDGPVNSCPDRPLVLGLQHLYQMVLGLAQGSSQGGTVILRHVSGDGQTGTAGAILDGSLAVEVVDGQGKPIEDALVIFAVTSGGGKLEPSERTTDSAGIAEVLWALGDSGAQQVTATTNGAASPVVFNATIVS
jgi:hypothetical protein